MQQQQQQLWVLRGCLHLLLLYMQMQITWWMKTAIEWSESQTTINHHTPSSIARIHKYIQVIMIATSYVVLSYTVNNLEIPCRSIQWYAHFIQLYQLKWAINLWCIVVNQLRTPYTKLHHFCPACLWLTELYTRFDHHTYRIIF